LKKAGKWAKLLLNLVNATADERTKLEAEAYYSWMEGNILIEKEKWEEASVLLIRAKYLRLHFLSLSLSVSVYELY
jgi:signal recognition particle subunit SRP68